MSDVPFAISLAPNPPLYPLSAGAGVSGVAPGAGLQLSEGQHLPVDVLRIEASKEGERPSELPRSMASAVPAIAIPSRRLSRRAGRVLREKRGFSDGLEDAEGEGRKKRTCCKSWQLCSERSIDA